MICTNDQYVCRIRGEEIEVSKLESKTIIEKTVGFRITTATLPADSDRIYFSSGDRLYTLPLDSPDEPVKEIALSETGTITDLYSACNNICTLLVMITKADILLIADQSGEIHCFGDRITLAPPYFSISLSSCPDLFADEQTLSAVIARAQSPANFFLSIALKSFQSLEYRLAVSLISGSSISIDVDCISTFIPRPLNPISYLKYFGRQLAMVTGDTLYLVTPTTYLTISIQPNAAKSVCNIEVYLLISKSSNQDSSLRRDSNKKLDPALFLFCRGMNCHLVNLTTRTVSQIADTTDAWCAYPCEKGLSFVSMSQIKEVPLSALETLF